MDDILAGIAPSGPVLLNDAALFDKDDLWKQ